MVRISSAIDSIMRHPASVWIDVQSTANAVSWEQPLGTDLNDLVSLSTKQEGTDGTAERLSDPSNPASDNADEIRRREDASCLQRVAQGDREAMRECVERFGNLVWKIAAAGVGRSCAADVSQEVFLSLWRSASRFDSTRGSASTFVSVLARRRVIDHHRRQESSLEVLNEEVVTNVDSGVDQSSGFSDSIERSETATQVGKAIDALDPPKPKLLRMAFFDGYSHAEIALKTELPIGTVKSHLRRGLNAVREVLRSEFAS